MEFLYVGFINVPSIPNLLGRCVTLSLDPKAAIVSRRKPPWNVLSHKPSPN